jgi:hypothetical protein
MDILIRLATLDDIDDIMNIQAMSYAIDICESVDVSRHIINANMSFVAIHRIQGILVVYILCHPTEKNKVIMLHAIIPSNNTHDCLFIHDLAIHIYYRTCGFGRLLANEAIHNSRASCVQLVAVNDTSTFWNKLKFYDDGSVDLTCKHIANYGGQHIVFMTRDLLLKQ